MKLVQKIAMLVSALIGFVLAAEQEGNGEKKKEKVIEMMKGFVKEYGEENLPGFIFELFQNDAFLSAILEVSVWSLKKFNLLK